MSLLSLVMLSMMARPNPGLSRHGLHGHKGPPPAVLSVGVGLFWQTHKARMGSDGMPSATGMSAFWKTPYLEQRSRVTLYGQSGVGVSLPSDSYSVVNLSQAPMRVPMAVQLERVAAPIANPLAGVTPGLSLVANGIGLNTHFYQKTILGDLVWVENVRIHTKLAKGILKKVTGLTGYATMALARKSDFYRVVIVERPLPSGDEIGAGVFLTPKTPPRSMVTLVNSLPG